MVSESARALALLVVLTHESVTGEKRVADVPAEALEAAPGPSEINLDPLCLGHPVTLSVRDDGPADDRSSRVGPVSAT